MSAKAELRFDVSKFLLNYESLVGKLLRMANKMVFYHSRLTTLHYFKGAITKCFAILLKQTTSKFFLIRLTLREPYDKLINALMVRSMIRHESL